MELILSAIAAGGLVGAGNQYLCLLIISGAARLGWITLSPEMRFMESWWFIGIVAFFWLLTIAPAYASTLGPGVMNVVNTVVNSVSGFAVPVSAALLALAAVGVIVGMHPELHTALRAIQVFADGDGTIGGAGLLIITGSALTASALTGSKFLAKPALSTVTGSTGTTAAPIYATIENVASVLLMLFFYVLTRINPWLLVGLVVLVTLIILGVLAYTIYRLWKLAKGIGQVIHLLETNPKAGLSVIGEFLVWGLGWLIWEHWNRGIVRLTLWVLWVTVMIVTVVVVVPAVATALAAALAIVPPLLALVPGFGVLIEAVVVTLAVATSLFIGMRSARSLMKTFDEVEPAPSAAPAPQPSPS